MLRSGAIEPLPDDLVESLDREDRALCRQAYKEGHVRPLAAGAAKTAAPRS